MTAPSTTAPTRFAPAERAPDEVVRRQAQDLESIPGLKTLLDAIPDLVVLLNHQRQIVFANRTARERLSDDTCPDLVGWRPGKALRCRHARETTGGCGTTETCSTCGAVRAILRGQSGESTREECRILQDQTGNALDLAVFATPVSLRGHDLVMLVAEDIAHEKRRQALERVFFHDVLNTAGGVLGFVELLGDADPSEESELIRELRQLANQLLEEIESQRDYLAAERDELAVNRTAIDSRQILEDVAATYRRHPMGRNRCIQVHPQIGPVTFSCDRTLLGRILGNMTKNALEASEPGDTITLQARPHGDEIFFSVHNPGVMPRPVQLQVFKRSYSTKGPGRGLGTFSMKLLAERYLGGAVSFTSTPDHGTTFTVRIPTDRA